MNEQEQAWSGSFGDEYTRRNNKVDWRARIPFWHDIMKFTGARSVYEVGCGAGWNLSAIREASPHKVGFFGCDVNMAACRQCWAAGFQEVHCESLPNMSPTCELIFTAGTLIHVAPENLETMMLAIVGAGTDWVLAIEYFSVGEEMIEYRGQQDRLWKRDYGTLYQTMGLSIIHTGDATGFDRCAYWLMRKK